MGGTLLTIILTYYWIRKRYIGVDKEQHAAIAALVTSAATERSVRAKNASITEQNEAENQRIKATLRVFNAFDLDDGGSIDFTELRGVLGKLYPSASPTLVRGAETHTVHATSCTLPPFGVCMYSMHSGS